MALLLRDNYLSIDPGKRKSKHLALSFMPHGFASLLVCGMRLPSSLPYDSSATNCQAPSLSSFPFRHIPIEGYINLTRPVTLTIFNWILFIIYPLHIIASVLHPHTPYIYISDSLAQCLTNTQPYINSLSNP